MPNSLPEAIISSSAAEPVTPASTTAHANVDAGTTPPTTNVGSEATIPSEGYSVSVRAKGDSVKFVLNVHVESQRETIRRANQILKGGSPAVPRNTTSEETP